MKIAKIRPVNVTTIRWYQSALLKVGREWENSIRATLSTGVVDSVVRELRVDDAISDLQELTVDLQARFDYTQPTVEQYARDAYGRTDEQHVRRWRSEVERAYGVMPYLPEDWQSGFIRAFVADNTALVKNASEDMRKKIENTIIQGARTGKRPEEIEKDLAGVFKANRSRLKLIARDQVSKLYGQINKKRAEDIGSTQYMWETAGDERVRKSHADNDRKRMKWSNSNVEFSGGKWVTRAGYKGIPGEDYQCRCVALVILPDELSMFNR